MLNNPEYYKHITFTTRDNREERKRGWFEPQFTIEDHGWFIQEGSDSLFHPDTIEEWCYE